MLSERIQTKMMRLMQKGIMEMRPFAEAAGRANLPASLPTASKPDEACLLYLHIPFCERLCPYCSFCRYPFEETKARAYFEALRKEMHMVANLGYAVESLYIGGGTPTILIDELAKTIDLAHELFTIREVSCETNPNHLIPSVLNTLEGRVQRLSVGVQSFDDDLLKRMQRYDKYGSGMEILERLTASEGYFESLNADMIFNFPTQTEETLIYDLAAILESGVSQTTFYPLMASPAVEKSLAATLGKVDYKREARFYEIISQVLTSPEPINTSAPGVFASPYFSAPQAPYAFGSAWTFNASSSTMIDEYIVNHFEYPAIGAGSFSYLDGSLYVNTFSVDEYISQINQGQMSVKQMNTFSKDNRMRYRLMMQLFGLELDKVQWKKDFGVSVAKGLPAEYAFFKSVGAFEEDNKQHITLTPKGRYLMVALMREFFTGVNNLRDIARSTLPKDERALLFD